MSVDESESEAAARMNSVHGLNATLGLVIHGAADGIALGASSLASGKKSLSLIVFLAVIVHKGSFFLVREKGKTELFINCLQALLLWD